MKQVLLFLFPLLLFAQPQFFGHYESEADLMQLGSNRYFFGYNKFRLDLEARPNDHILIGANFNIQRYWGQSTWNIFDFIPGYSNMVTSMDIELPDTLLLDNAYMRLRFRLIDVTLGRQQISPGVGYAWNPTDIFNAKSMLDPSYEQTGVQGVRFEIPVLQAGTFTSFIQPENSWNQSAYQFWLKSGLGHFDFSVTLAEHNWPYYSIYNQPDLRRQLKGFSLVGEIAGFGTWIEAALSTAWTPGSQQETTFDWDEWVVGVDYTTESSIYMLFEYLHNGLGQSQQVELQLLDYLQVFEGTRHSLMQDYGFFYITHPTFDYVSLSAMSIANFNDHSGTFAPQLDWNAFENTNLSLQTSLFWGEAGAEFGLQDWGVRLRVRSDF